MIVAARLPSLPGLRAVALCWIFITTLARPDAPRPDAPRPPPCHEVNVLGPTPPVPPSAPAFCLLDPAVAYCLNGGPCCGESGWVCNNADYVDWHRRLCGAWNP